MLTTKFSENKSAHEILQMFSFAAIVIGIMQFFYPSNDALNLKVDNLTATINDIKKNMDIVASRDPHPEIFITNPSDSNIWNHYNCDRDWYNPPLYLATNELRHIDIKSFSKKTLTRLLFFIEGDSILNAAEADQFVRLARFLTIAKRANLLTRDKIKIRYIIKTRPPRHAFFVFKSRTASPTKELQDRESILYPESDYSPSKCILSYDEYIHQSLLTNFNFYWETTQYQIIQIDPFKVSLIISPQETNPTNFDKVRLSFEEFPERKSWSKNIYSYVVE